MLTDTAASKSSNAMGRSTKSRMRAPRVAASSTPLKPSHTTTNSSPPVRAMVSASRSARLKRRATSINTRSPPSCPTESFTTLNASRSQNNTAVMSFARAVRASAMDRRSIRSSRFGSPVSGSCSVSSMSSPSAALRSVMSRALVTMPRHGRVLEAVRVDGLEPAPHAALVADTQLGGWLRDVGFEEPGDEPVAGREVDRVDQVTLVRAFEVLGSITQRRPHRGTAVREHPRGIADEHDVSGALGERAEPLATRVRCTITHRDPTCEVRRSGSRRSALVHAGTSPGQAEPQRSSREPLPAFGTAPKVVGAASRERHPRVTRA